MFFLDESTADIYQQPTSDLLISGNIALTWISWSTSHLPNLVLPCEPGGSECSIDREKVGIVAGKEHLAARSNWLIQTYTMIRYERVK